MLKNRADFLSAYNRIVENLHDEAWLPGTQLPNASVLAALYKVDIDAVEDAIDQLAKEQLLLLPTDGVAIVTGASSQRHRNRSAVSLDAIDDKRQFASALGRFLDWASDEALEFLFDDVVAKHLAAASARLEQRFFFNNE